MKLSGFGGRLASPGVNRSGLRVLPGLSMEGRAVNFRLGSGGIEMRANE